MRGVMNETTLRNSWEFEYTAKRVAEAATSKRDIHTKKRTWWEEKKAEALAKIKESGVEITESLAASYSNTKAGFGPEVTINDGLSKQLTEAHQKILEHDRLVREYDGWRQVLDANPESRLKLRHQDWLFFFGE